jgi:hypothetical protein
LSRWDGAPRERDGGRARQRHPPGSGATVDGSRCAYHQVPGPGARRRRVADPRLRSTAVTTGSGRDRRRWSSRHRHADGTTVETRSQLAPTRGPIMDPDAAVRRNRRTGTPSGIAEAATLLGDQLSLGRTGLSRPGDMVPSTVHRSVPAGERTSSARWHCCGRCGPLGTEPPAVSAPGGDHRSPRGGPYHTERK